MTCCSGGHGGRGRADQGPARAAQGGGSGGCYTRPYLARQTRCTPTAPQDNRLDRQDLERLREIGPGTRVSIRRAPYLYGRTCPPGAGGLRAKSHRPPRHHELYLVSDVLVTTLLGMLRIAVDGRRILFFTYDLDESTAKPARF